MKNNSTVIDWLLGEDQPSVRYLALTQLLERKETDSEVKSAKNNIPKSGWAKDILDKQAPEGFWYQGKSLFMPRFLATFWMILILSDLGLTREDPAQSHQGSNNSNSDPKIEKMRFSRASFGSQPHRENTGCDDNRNICRIRQCRGLSS